jgi:hypothetical protein
MKDASTTEALLAYLRNLYQEQRKELSRVQSAEMTHILAANLRAIETTFKDLGHDPESELGYPAYDSGTGSGGQ